MRARGIHGLRPAVLLAMAAIILLYPWGTLEAGASPAPPPGPPAVDPSGGLLPDQASDRAVEVIGEKLVSRGGRYHDLDDARAAPEAALRASSVAASGDYRVDSLLSGYQWTVPTITYSFYSSAVFGSSYYVLRAGGYRQRGERGRQER